jgi:curved DNA-binding protein CbpA
MATGNQGGPGPDLYELLGVGRDASREEIALAWRRRARAEHPDARPADAGAPGRFRALAEAWEVLGNPARRAAYDRARGQQPASGIRITVRRPGTGTTGGMPPPGRAAEPPLRATEPPLRAGPIWVDSPGQTPTARREEADMAEMRLAVLAELALRFLAARRDQPW